jgi:hypothetical protein
MYIRKMLALLFFGQTVPSGLLMDITMHKLMKRAKRERETV